MGVLKGGCAASANKSVEPETNGSSDPVREWVRYSSEDKDTGAAMGDDAKTDSSSAGSALYGGAGSRMLGRLGNGSGLRRDGVGCDGVNDCELSFLECRDCD